MKKFKKKIEKKTKLSKNSQKNRKKFKNCVIFVTFFPNPVKSQKYTQNHDHTTFLDKKNY